MKAITHRFGAVTLHLLPEAQIGPEVQGIFDGLTPETLRPADWLFAHHVTPGGDLISLSQCLVVIVAARIVLVDTCIGNDKPRPHLPAWDRLQTGFLQDLEGLGIGVEDVTDVLCTHLHADHVGWNTRWQDGRWRPTFPKARHYFDRAEYDALISRLDAGPNLETMAYEDSVRPIFQAGQAVLVDESADLGDGISLLPTPGHTPGHVSIAIQAGDTRLLITGDAIHHPLQLAWPDWSTTIDHNPGQAAQSRWALLSAAALPGAVLVGTHFAHPALGRVSALEDRTYRFETAGFGDR